MNPLHKIRRKYQKLLIDSKRYPKPVQTTFEKETLLICRNLIRSSETKLLVSSDMKRRLIVHDSLKIKIVIEHDRIILSNPDYHELPTSTTGIKQIIRIFDARLDNEIISHELQMKKIAKGTFDNIVMLTNYLLNSK